MRAIRHCSAADVSAGIGECVYITQTHALFTRTHKYPLLGHRVIVYMICSDVSAAWHASVFIFANNNNNKDAGCWFVFGIFVHIIGSVGLSTIQQSLV